MKILNGSLDNIVFFVAVDRTDGSTRETGLSGFVVHYQLGGGSSDTMTDPTIAEVDGTNMEGVYGLLIGETLMTQLSDDKSEELILHITHANIRDISRNIEVYAKPNDGKFNS